MRRGRRRRAELSYCWHLKSTIPRFIQTGNHLGELLRKRVEAVLAGTLQRDAPQHEIAQLCLNDALLLRRK